MCDSTYVVNWKANVLVSFFHGPFIDYSSSLLWSLIRLCLINSRFFTYPKIYIYISGFLKLDVVFQTLEMI